MLSWTECSSLNKKKRTQNTLWQFGFDNRIVTLWTPWLGEFCKSSVFTVLKCCLCADEGPQCIEKAMFFQKTVHVDKASDCPCFVCWLSALTSSTCALLLCLVISYIVLWRIRSLPVHPSTFCLPLQFFSSFLCLLLPLPFPFGFVCFWWLKSWNSTTVPTVQYWAMHCPLSWCPVIASVAVKGDIVLLNDTP